jgi:hypothetical protein
VHVSRKQNCFLAPLFNSLLLDTEDGGRTILRNVFKTPPGYRTSYAFIIASKLGSLLRNSVLNEKKIVPVKGLL